MFAYGLVPVSKSSTQALAHTTMVLELSGRETLNKKHTDVEMSDSVGAPPVRAFALSLGFALLGGGLRL